MKFSPLILFFLILALSCNNVDESKENNTKGLEIKIPPFNKKYKFLRYSDVFDSIKIVKLETKKECKIGRIDKILVHDHDFYILDQVQSKAVFEFGPDGKFLRKFGAVGVGSGKYQKPTDMSFLENKLAIWSKEDRKFLIYKTDGTLLREFTTNSYSKSAVALNKSTFVQYLDIGADYHTDEKYDIKFLDNNGNLTRHAEPINRKQFNEGSFFLTKNNNEILFAPNYSNEIYTIDQDQNISLKYLLDLGQNKIPDNFANGFSTAVDFLKALSKSNYAYLDSYMETPNCLIFTIDYKSVIYSYLYSKKTKTLKYSNIWVNDIYGVLTGTINTIDGDISVACYDPSSIESLKKTLQLSSDAQIKTLVDAANKMASLDNSENNNANFFNPKDFRKSIQEIELVKSINPTDNPILILQRIKKF